MISIAFSLSRDLVRRHLGEPLVAFWVWHSDVTGRNPHVHVFMRCPPRAATSSRALAALSVGRDRRARRR